MVRVFLDYEFEFENKKYSKTGAFIGEFESLKEVREYSLNIDFMQIMAVSDAFNTSIDNEILMRKVLKSAVFNKEKFKLYSELSRLF